MDLFDRQFEVFWATMKVAPFQIPSDLKQSLKTDLRGIQFFEGEIISQWDHWEAFFDIMTPQNVPYNPRYSHWTYYTKSRHLLDRWEHWDDWKTMIADDDCEGDDPFDQIHREHVRGVISTFNEVIKSVRKM
jgi:hypothetical protein